MSASRSSGRIKPEILHRKAVRLGAKIRPFPHRIEIRKWMRGQTKLQLRHASNAWFTRLRAGKSVPWNVLEILAGVLNVNVEDLAELCTDSLPPIDAVGPWWGRGWNAMMAAIRPLVELSLALPPLTMCKTEEDVLQAASMCLEWLGRNVQSGKEDCAITKEQAISLGEENIGRSVEDNAKLFRRLVEFHQACIKFTVARDERGVETRVGITVFLPLTEGAYMRLRSGQVDPPDFVKEDLQARSQYILWLGLTEVSGAQFENRKAIADAQLPNILYQLAAFCGRRTPNIISVCANPLTKKRLVAHSYKSVGTFSPNARLEIMELASTPNCWHSFEKASANGDTDFGSTETFFNLVWLVSLAMTQSQEVHLCPRCSSVITT